MSPAVERGAWHERNRASERDAALLGTSNAYQTGLGPGVGGGAPRTLLGGGQNNLVYSPRVATEGGGESNLMMRTEQRALQQVAIKRESEESGLVADLSQFDQRLGQTLKARPRLADPSLQSIAWYRPSPLDHVALLSLSPGKPSLRLRPSAASASADAQKKTGGSPSRAEPKKKRATLLASDLSMQEATAAEAAREIAKLMTDYQQERPFITKILRPPTPSEVAPSPADALPPPKVPRRKVYKDANAGGGRNGDAAPSGAAANMEEGGEPDDPRLAAQLECLSTLDDRLEDRLRDGTVRLLSADFVRMGFLTRMETRQDLERLERDEGKRIFLSADEACNLIQRARREVCCLCYPWLTPTDPDPLCTHLTAVKRYLRSREGSHVQGLFWDYASVPQVPRSAAEEATAAAALSVLGDLYASPLGTCVLRQLETPPRPESLDGVLVLRNAAPSVTEQGLRDVLVAVANKVRVKTVEYDATFAIWRVQLGFHQQAYDVICGVEAAKKKVRTAEPGVSPGRIPLAVAALGADLSVAEWYNETPTAQRAWVRLETSLASEPLSRVFHHVDALPLRAHLELKLPPKIVDLQSDELLRASPRASPVRATVGADAMHVGWGEGYPERVQRMRRKIMTGYFTGRSSDLTALRDVYDDVVHRLHFGLRPACLQGDDEALETAMRGRLANDGSYQGDEKEVYSQALNNGAGGKYFVREGQGVMTWQIRADLATGEMLADRSVWHPNASSHELGTRGARCSTRSVSPYKHARCSRFSAVPVADSALLVVG